MKLRQAAQAVSIVLHPMLMPLYCCVIVMYGPTIFRFLPVEAKPVILLFISALCIGLPLLSLPLLKVLGLIKSYSLSSQQDRILPLFLTALAYFLCMVFMTRWIGYTLARILFIGATLSVIFSIVITTFWKISLHSVGIGGSIALLWSLTLLGYGILTGWILLGIACAGLLISCRLYLDKHTPYQVLAGFALGFLTVIICSYLL